MYPLPFLSTSAIFIYVTILKSGVDPVPALPYASCELYLFSYVSILYFCIVTFVNICNYVQLSYSELYNRLMSLLVFLFYRIKCF